MPTLGLHRWTTAAIAILMSFAGCVDSGEESLLEPPTGPVVSTLPPNDMRGYVSPFVLGHDHSDASLHDLAFHTRQLWHHAMGGSVAKSSGAHVVDIQGDWMFVGAYGFSVDVQGGVYIYDVSDPQKPLYVSWFPMLGNVGGDRSVEATPDANWVVVGAEPIDCAGHVNPFAPGLYLIDVRNKAAPLLSDYDPLAASVHSVMVHRVDGIDYVVSLDASAQNIRRIDAATGKFVPVGSVSVGHDGAIVNDPILGIPVFYAATSSNLQIYDFSDPSNPLNLATWAPSDDHYVHAVAADLIEGRRIVVVESEDWGSTASPFWVLDATDFEDIELLATFTNLDEASANMDGENGASSLGFSTHNPRMQDGILYMAHYHAGGWIFDLRTLERARNPEIMGYFLPHEDNGGYRPMSSSSPAPLPNACGFNLNEIPNSFDIEVKDGVAFLTELHTGIYAFEYDPSVVPK